MYLTYNGTEITTALNLDLITLIDGINSFTFDVPPTEHSTWLDRFDEDVQIYDDDDELLGTCFISNITKTLTLVHISCLGTLAKLGWWMIPDGVSKYWIEKGLVHTSTSTYIMCYDEDNQIPADWAADQYNGQFVIVSEGTLEDTPVVFDHSPYDYLGYGYLSQYIDSGSGDYTNVKKIETTGQYKEIVISSNSTNITKYLISLEVQHYNIPDTATLLKLTVEATGTHLVSSSYLLSKSYWFDLVGTTSLSAAAAFIWESPGIKIGQGTVVWGTNTSIETDLSRVFTTQGGIYSGGYIGIFFYNFNNTKNYTIKWHSLKVTLTYRTKTFDEINVVITDTASRNLYGGVDFHALGVADGDHWTVCKSIDAALASISSGAVVSVPYEINKGNPFNKGYSQEFYGLTALTMAQNICETADARYFEECESGSSILQFVEEQYCTVEATPLTGFKRLDSFETENNIYGSISIATAAGIVNVTVPGSSYVKQYCETRDDILSAAGGFAYATKLASKFADFRRSIKLEFDTYILIRVGHKYTFTIDSVEYTDQICRKVMVHHDGANGKQTVIAYFGGGNTPDEEKIGMAIGKQIRRLNRKDALKWTTDLSPVTRYSQLNGIPSTFTPAAHTQAESTITSSITAGNLIKSDGSKLADSGITVDTSTDLDGASASNSKVPSQLAVKTYVDAGLRYVSLDTDHNAWTYVGTSSTNGGTVVLDLINGTSTETNVTQTSESWTNVIPSTAKAVELLIRVTTSSAHTSNVVYVRKNGNSNFYQTLRCSCPSVASYENDQNGKVAVSSDGKIQVYFGIGAGTTSFYMSLLGYYI